MVKELDVNLCFLVKDPPPSAPVSCEEMNKCGEVDLRENNQESVHALSVQQPHTVAVFLRWSDEETRCGRTVRPERLVEGTRGERSAETLGELSPKAAASRSLHLLVVPRLSFWRSEVERVADPP